MDQSALIAVASIVVVVLGSGAAVALRISFNKRNEVRGGGGGPTTATSSRVSVKGNNNITAARDAVVNTDRLDPGQSAEPGDQNGTA